MTLSAFVMMGDLTFDIKRGGWRLSSAPTLLATAQLREADTKICCELFARRPAG